MKFLSPKFALDFHSRTILPNLDNLIMKYGHLVDSQADIQREWSDLVAYFSAEDRNQLLEKSCEEFWVYLSKLQSFSDEFVFQKLPV